MRDVTEIKSTYRQMSETVRREIRPCFICNDKHTPKCRHCPPPDVRKDILAMLSFANKKMKEQGIYLPTESTKELRITSEEEFTDCDLEELLKNL